MSRISKKDAVPVTHLVPKEMKQYCIETSHYEDTIEAIPNTIKIKEIVLRFCQGRWAADKIPVPTALRKLGVTQLYEHKSSREARAALIPTSKIQLTKDVNLLCNKLNTDKNRVIVSRINLSYMDAEVTFTRVAKEIYPNEDKRMKLFVLGMSDSDGNAAPLLKKLSAVQYACSIQRVITNQVICSTKTAMERR